MRINRKSAVVRTMNECTILPRKGHQADFLLLVKVLGLSKDIYENPDQMNLSIEKVVVGTLIDKETKISLRLYSNEENVELPENGKVFLLPVKNLGVMSDSLDTYNHSSTGCWMEYSNSNVKEWIELMGDSLVKFAEKECSEDTTKKQSWLEVDSSSDQATIRFKAENNVIRSLRNIEENVDVEPQTPTVSKIDCRKKQIFIKNLYGTPEGNATYSLKDARLIGFRAPF